MRTKEDIEREINRCLQEERQARQTCSTDPIDTDLNVSEETRLKFIAAESKRINDLVNRISALKWVLSEHK